MEKLDRTKNKQQTPPKKQNKTKVPSLSATLSTSFHKYTRTRRV